MSDFPSTARAVVIGCGIVGNSLAYHLTHLGWTDVVLIDKGPLPNPGGSTGHASNFIFLVDHSKEMTQLTLERSASTWRWASTPSAAASRSRAPRSGWRSCGGAWRRRSRGASTRHGSSPPPRSRSSSRTSTSRSCSAASTAPPSPSSTRCGPGRSCASAASRRGRLQVFAGTDVLGMDVEGGRIRRLHTSRGTIEAETVVIACGVWSPLLARMAGAFIPLTPAVHQMIDVGPVPRFEKSTSAIEFPIVRDMDVFMYERQDGVGLEIGSYAHRSILHDPEEIPSIEEAALSPTEFPFTQADFEPQMEHALELMPEIVGDESVGVKYAINGLISLTPDGMPILGETPEVKGLWSAAAVWVKEGPGVGKSVAEWMVHGESHIDLHSSDISRFHDAPEDACAREGAHVRGLPEDVRDRPPGRAVVERARRPALADARARAGARRGLLRGGRLGAAAVVRGERAARRALRRRGARGGVGRALVVADHQRRAPRDARARRALRPLRVRDLRRAGPGRARRAAARRAARRWTFPSAASSTRRCSARAAASSPTSRSCGSASRSSASSPAARTAWPTASGSATTSPPTARRSSST